MQLYRHSSPENLTLVGCEIFTHTVSIYMEDSKDHFKKLFEAHNDAVFRYLAYQLNDRERALEMTQEVFMNTWRHLSSGKTIDYEKTFLFKIARNLFINEIRTDKTTASLETLQDTTHFEPTDTAISPELYSEHQELLQYLEHIAHSYKEVLILRYIEGMTVKDIAQLLNEKETNISMRIKRGLEKLHTLYSPKP